MVTALTLAVFANPSGPASIAQLSNALITAPVLTAVLAATRTASLLPASASKDGKDQIAVLVSLDVSIYARNP
jgi:hypothetical protein